MSGAMEFFSSPASGFDPERALWLLLAVVLFVSGRILFELLAAVMTRQDRGGGTISAGVPVRTESRGGLRDDERVAERAPLRAVPPVGLDAGRRSASAGGARRERAGHGGTPGSARAKTRPARHHSLRVVSPSRATNSQRH